MVANQALVDLLKRVAQKKGDTRPDCTCMSIDLEAFHRADHQ